MFGYHRKPSTSTGEVLEKLLKSKREIPIPNYNRPTRLGTNPIPQSQNGRPKAPWEKDTSRLDEIFKEPTYDPPVINITGVSVDEAEELRKVLSRLDLGNLNGRRYNVLPRKNTLTYIYSTSGIDNAYTDDTIQEINAKLNSNKEFITIGNVTVKRESVIQVIKTDKEFKEDES